MDIAANVRKIKAEIEAINPEASIVAATKTMSVSAINECMATGLVDAAGENRVQELTEKYTDAYCWDFIGNLQSNKVKYLVGKVRLIHSLDRISLAETIEREYEKRGLVCKALIEINTGNEPNKGGIPLDDAERFIEELCRFSHIEICGLMAVAPLNADEKTLGKLFDAAYEKYFKLKTDVFRYLSMGMSNDYLLAVKSGANIVRPGRAIFGARDYKK